jgi:hypothetical protein
MVECYGGTELASRDLRFSDKAGKLGRLETSKIGPSGHL